MGQIRVITPENEKQAQHNMPRRGFTHNPYSSKLGRLFQETVKFGIEKAVGAAWKPLVRYKSNGDSKLYAEGLKNPDTVFKYDDELFSIINNTLKDTAKGYLDDNDAKRKREIVCQTFDLILTLAHEDVYYRGLLKKSLGDLFAALADRPDLLEFSKDELMIDVVLNGYKHSTRSPEAMKRKMIFNRVYEQFREEIENVTG